VTSLGHNCPGVTAGQPERADSSRPGTGSAMRYPTPGLRKRFGPTVALDGMTFTLRAEWTKLRTVPGTVWLLAATIVLTVGVSTAAAAATRCPVGTGCPVDTTKLSLTGVQFGQAVAAILAVLGISSEYSTGMIRTTFAAMPRRAVVLLAGGLLIRPRDA
jgi:hypothetical protein